MSTEEDSHEGGATSPATPAPPVKDDNPVIGLLVFGGALVVAGIIGGLALVLHIEPEGATRAFSRGHIRMLHSASP
ncbi:MAG TPA: hypothetical protein VGH43_03165 [Jatrophihabitans sp.]|jgi:hypothetical protein